MKKITILVFFITLTYLNLYPQWTVHNIAGTNTLNASYFIFGDSLTGWVAGNNASVYKTANGGASWNQQITGMPAGQFYSLAFANILTGWAFGTYQITGTTGYIYKTVNGGSNWIQQFSATNHAYYASFVRDSLNCWVAGSYFSTSDLILRTTNGGVNWKTLDSSNYPALKSIFFVNALTGWAAGNNTMLKTTTSGSSWISSSFTGNVYSMYFNNASTGWAGLDNGTLLKTTNAGSSWYSAFSTGVSSPISSISFPSITTGYFTFSNVVFKTTNSGNSWVPYETAVQGNIQSISCPTVNNCFAAQTLGNVEVTSNGGGNFSSNRITFRRNNLNKFITLNNVTYDTIAITLDRSTDAVITDINVSIDTVLNTLDSTLVFILSHNNVSDTLIYRAGGGGSNFIGTNLNDSASVLISGGTPPFTGTYRPSRPLSQFNYVSYNGLWILKIKDSNSGKSDRTGVIKSWSITITYNFSIGVNNISKIIPSAFELKQNYPNPFNPVTNIKFSVKETNLVTLKVYDILGKEVSALVNENLNPGEYEAKFDASLLTSGIYFYRLTAGDFTAAKKLILIK